jgi:hypothetical protein
MGEHRHREDLAGLGDVGRLTDDAQGVGLLEELPLHGVAADERVENGAPRGRCSSVTEVSAVQRAACEVRQHVPQIRLLSRRRS